METKSAKDSKGWHDARKAVYLFQELASALIPLRMEVKRLRSCGLTAPVPTGKPEIALISMMTSKQFSQLN